MIEQDVKVYEKENIYELDNRIMICDYAERIVEKVRKRNNASGFRVLDLGLGHGYSAAVLEHAFDDYTVLEGDADMIQKYRQEHDKTHAKIVHTMFEDYETEDKYDVIIMGFVLEHVDNPVQIMARYRQFLARGG